MKTHLVYLLLAAFFMAGFSVPTKAFANETFEADQGAEILTYAQLMALPTHQRVEYIEGVRQILIDISKTKNGRFSDESPETKSKLEAWLKLIDRELQSAVAQTSGLCSANKTCADTARKCFEASRRLEYDSGSKTYDCGEAVKTRIPIDPSKVDDNDRLRRYMAKLADPGAETSASAQAPKRQPIPLMAASGRAPEAVAAARIVSSDAGTGSGLAAYISSGDKDVKDQECISKARTSSLAKEITDKLKPCSFAQEEELKRQYESIRRLTSGGATTGGPIATSKSRGLEVLPASEEVRAAATGSSETVGADTGATATGRSTLVLPVPIAGAEPKAEDYALKTQAVLDEKANGSPAAAAPVRPAPISTSAAMKLSCAPKVEKCDDPGSHRAEVAKPEQPCVFAGMVSKFDSRNRRCEPVTAFKVGELSLKCASGQTMCNPLLFGTVNSSTPICIGRGQDATLQCAKLSAPRDAERFFNRDVAGMQNNWDEFRSKLSKVCAPGPSQKFHCNECNILNTRLFELEVRVIGSNLRCTGRTTIETIHEHRREKRIRDGKIVK